MSILYQALKVEKQQERQSQGARAFGSSAQTGTRHMRADFALRPSPTRLIVIFTVTAAAVLLLGLGTWHLWQPSANAPSTPQNALVVPEITQPAPPPTNPHSAIAEIAALLPPQVAEPLPLGADESATLSSNTNLASIQVGAGQVFSQPDQPADYTTSALSQPELVIEHLALRAAANPADAISRAQYGQALAQMGDWAKARRELTAAARLAPQNPQILYNLAVLYDQMAEPALALQTYDAALRAQQTKPAAGLNNQQIEQRIQQLMAGR